MNTFTDIIKAFDGKFAEALGVKDSHVRTMKARDSIPYTRWADTVDAAQRMQVPGVTLELLARLGSTKSRKAAQ
jgi:hypothetical protein